MKAAPTICLALIVMTIPAITMADEHSAAEPSGQAVFESSCANCHDSLIGGFMTGAPEIGDKEDWAPLLPKGLDGLTGTTIAGIGEMDARGGCAECTDEEIRAAVEYIIEQSQ